MMSIQYGYGRLEDELIELFQSGAPDFIKAEELIHQGANLNASGKDEVEDVSECFECVVGYSVDSIEFDHKAILSGNTYYGQPIIKIEMDSGVRVLFSINFGEVEETDRAAFYEIVKE